MNTGKSFDFVVQHLPRNGHFYHGRTTSTPSFRARSRANSGDTPPFRGKPENLSQVHHLETVVGSELRFDLCYQPRPGIIFLEPFEVEDGDAQDLFRLVQTFYRSWRNI